MKITQEHIKNILKIAVAIGAFWVVYRVAISFDKNNEDRTYKQLQKVCGVILQQQPNNISLYDDCMNNGLGEMNNGVDESQ